MSVEELIYAVESLTPQARYKFEEGLKRTCKPPLNNIRIKTPVKIGTRAQFNLYKQITTKQCAMMFQTPSSVLGSMWSARTPSCPGPSIILELGCGTGFCSTVSLTIDSVIERASRARPELFAERLRHATVGTDVIRLCASRAALTVVRPDGKNIPIEALSKGSKVSCLFTMDCIWTTSNLFGVDLIARSVMDLSVETTTTKTPPPPPPRPPPPLMTSKQSFKLKPKTDKIASRAVVMPSLADIIGARGRLKSAIDVKQLEKPVAPRTVLDDIKSGSFSLKKMI